MVGYFSKCGYLEEELAIVDYLECFGGETSIGKVLHQMPIVDAAEWNCP